MFSVATMFAVPVLLSFHIFPVASLSFFFFLVDMFCFTGIQVLQGTWASCWLARLWLLFGHVESWLHVCWNGITMTFIHYFFSFHQFCNATAFFYKRINWCWFANNVLLSADLPQGAIFLWSWQPWSTC